MPFADVPLSARNILEDPELKNAVKAYSCLLRIKTSPTTLWVRGEEGDGSSFQVVVTVGTRRVQIFIPASEFGGGWGDVALVFEGFGLGDGWVRQPSGFERKVVSTPGPVSSPATGVSGGVTVGHSSVEANWFRLLDCSLVGQFRDLDGKGLSFADMSDWVLRWWKLSATVEVRPLGHHAFLFVFPSRREAEAILCRSWIVAGRVLELVWWNPLALCASDSASPSTQRIWVQVVGLLIHLRGLEVYRQIGDQCGGFVVVDESSVDMSSVRLCVRRSRQVLSRVSLRWGLWNFSLPIWVEAGPMAEPAVTVADLRLDKAGRDSRSSNRNLPKFMGVKAYQHRFLRESEFNGPRVRVMGKSGGLGFRGDLGPTYVGKAKAQNDGFHPKGTHKWVSPLVLGPVKQGAAPVTQPNPCGSVSGQPDPPNPSISRVFASLHAGIGSSNSVRAVDSSVEDVRPPVAALGGGFVELQSSDCFVDDVLLVGGSGGGSMVLHSSLGVVTDGCLLAEAGSALEECRQVDIACRDKRGTVENVARDRWVASVDELALVVCLEVAGHGEQALPAAVEAVDLLEFLREESPSTEEVSNWVLSRIHEVSQFLGVSFEGHEDEAMNLFIAIEESWKEGVPVRQDVNPVELNGRRCRGGWDTSFLLKQGGSATSPRVSWLPWFDHPMSGGLYADVEASLPFQPSYHLCNWPIFVSTNIYQGGVHRRIRHHSQHAPGELNFEERRR
ncbi:hypothetical protein LOK49_Contig11G00022 [Camellia lanceoleosa]|nr:hypothetical protein LOK49_Contig11G00022 [Camellia lanceoleosa]